MPLHIVEGLLQHSIKHWEQIARRGVDHLRPVFDVILEKALSLGEAAFGTLWIYHGDTMHAAATPGMTPALAEFQAVISMENARLLIMRALVEYTDMRTVLFVPLRKDGASRATGGTARTGFRARNPRSPRTRA
jgi:hypothetical protein